MMVPQLGFVLRSPNTELLKTFYEVLGVSFEIHKHESGPVHASSIIVGGSVFEIYESKPPRHTQDALLIELSSVKQTLETLKTHGFLIDPQTVKQNPDMVYIKDPDGRLVLLVESH